MEQLVENFLKERKYHNRSLNTKEVLRDSRQLKSLEDEFYDYIFKVYLCSYIKKTIAFSAMQIKKKHSKMNERENLILNVIDPDFNEERLNFIADRQEDFLEDVYPDSNYKELSHDKNIIKAINTLTDKQKEIIYQCIILGERDTLVAKKLGISKQGVNKIKITALKKLRNQLTDTYNTKSELEARYYAK